MTPVAGQTLRDQAIRVSGALAELSISELSRASGSHTLKEGSGKPHTGPAAILQSRLTDLPGVLSSAPVGTRIRAEALDLTIEVQSAGLAWFSSNPTHAGTFAAALSRA